MNQKLHVYKTNFHMKGFAPGLALKQRPKATRKSPINILLSGWYSCQQRTLVLVTVSLTACCPYSMDHIVHIDSLPSPSLPVVSTPPLQVWFCSFALFFYFLFSYQRFNSKTYSISLSTEWVPLALSAATWWPCVEIQVSLMATIRELQKGRAGTDTVMTDL